MSNPCSTPPSEPVAWLCVRMVGPLERPLYVSARTWFDARSFAAAHFGVTHHAIHCELLTLDDARDFFLTCLKWHARQLAELSEAA